MKYEGKKTCEKIYLWLPVVLLLAYSLGIAGEATKVNKERVVVDLTQEKNGCADCHQGSIKTPDGKEKDITLAGEAKNIPKHPRLDAKATIQACMKCHGAGERRVLLSINAAPLFGGPGEVVGMVATVEDVTQRKKTEEMLLSREKEIRMIAENVPALFSYVDAKGCYRFVNKRYEDWFGLPKNKILGKHYREVLGEATYELIRKEVEAALSGSQVNYVEGWKTSHRKSEGDAMEGIEREVRSHGGPFHSWRLELGDHDDA